MLTLTTKHTDVERRAAWSTGEKKSRLYGLMKNEDEEAVVTVGVFRDRRNIALAISTREKRGAEAYLDPEGCNKVVKYLEKAAAEL
jgi:hypothetical protein